MKLAASKTRGEKRAAPASVRVAVYCRQSVEKEMEFSSCDAQRATIEAYITAQASNGWFALPERYDDAGYSGGNIQRPAYQRLMQDVREGRVDVVAVYRIDRLSRSMNDFTATLSEFARHAVSFVSVTQAFDTSTSTGQLMANLLGSFSQFERQQIGERIRDKMAETRRRGGWQAGFAPYGYRSAKGALNVVKEEAEVAELIFELYLAMNALSNVATELNARGHRMRSGRHWSKKEVHRVLRCKTLAGWVPYAGEWYEGKHARIIDRGIFELVQTKLSKQSLRGGSSAKNKYGLLLRGLLHCARCQRSMVVTYSMTPTKRFHYYVCRSRHDAEPDPCPGSRVAAGNIEGFVVQQIEAIGSDPRVLAKALQATLDQARARVPELEAERRRHGDEIRKLRAERERFLVGIAAGGPAASVLSERVGQIDESIARAERAEHVAQGELLVIAGLELKDAEIRAALTQFHGVWAKLVAKERARILSLLIDRIDYNGEAGEIEIKFRPGGIRALGNQMTAVEESA
ncbi:MAG: recombinase family protein [Planctomycetes bacterium]|nr:recombinase family protein [Planctomycetota bacterium]